MTDINNVVLVGRLVRDVDFGMIGSGTAKAEVSIACNRSVKKNDQWTDEVSYFDVTIWGKTAENLQQYLTKGKQICVEGYLKQERWEKDGQKHSKLSIVANNVQLLGGNNGNSKSESSGAVTEQIPF